MKSWKLGVVLALAIILAGCSQQKKAETAEQTEVKATSAEITLTDITPLNDLMSSPEEYVGKTLLIEGHVSGRCAGSGCWVSLATDNPEGRLIVRTIDESFIFPAECVDKDIQVQGTLMVKAVEEDEHAHDAADHECPDPEYYFHPEAMKIKA